MIQSFRCRRTEAFWRGRKPLKRFPPEIAQTALDRLDILHAAVRLDVLRSPPGNHLEALKGDLAGFHSIRINIRWRIVFRWTENGPADVAIVDYH